MLATRRLGRRVLAAAKSVTLTDLNDSSLVTVSEFLRSLGATDDLVRRYASQVGKRAKATGVARSSRWIVVAHRARRAFTKTGAAYAPDSLPGLLAVIADYLRTAHLAASPAAARLALAA